MLELYPNHSAADFEDFIYSSNYMDNKKLENSDGVILELHVRRWLVFWARKLFVSFGIVAMFLAPVIILYKSQ